MEAKISVVPLTYKSSYEQINKFFEQIKSFLYEIELIIVLEKDDLEGLIFWGKAIQEYKVKKYKLEKLINTKTKGECLNKALSICSFEFIMRCDMDDIILPNRYKLTMEAINDESFSKDLIYSDMIDMNNNKLLKYPILKNIDLFSVFKNPFPAPTTCFRKSFFIRNKLRFPKSNRCEDLYLSLSFIDKKANFYKLKKPIVKYNNNNNFKRDYMHWFTNALIRFKIRSRRLDPVGLFSVIFILFIFSVGLIKLILNFFNYFKRITKAYKKTY